MRLSSCFCIFFTSLWVGVGSQSWAQESTPVLTLREALQLARTNYPQLKSREHEVQARQQQVDVVRAGYLPRAGVQTQTMFATSNQVRGASYTYDGLTVPVSGSIREAGFDARPAWTSLASLVIDWKAVTFGRLAADRALAQAQVEQSSQQYQQELFEHQIRVADAYLLALNTRKFAELQRQNLRRAEEILRVTSANASSGLKAGLDSSIAAVETTRARLQWLESQNQAERQSLSLAELIGRAGEVIQLDTTHFFSDLPTRLTFDSSRIEGHPSLRPLQAQIRLADQQSQVIRLQNRPTLYLLGSVWGRGSGIQERLIEGQFQISSSPMDGLPLRAYNYAVGATLTWHITQLFQTKYQLKVQRERVSMVKENYNQAFQTLKTARKNADLQFVQAYQAVQHTPVLLETAQRAFAQSKARYENGLENIMLLTQVADLYIRAETDYAVSINNLWRSLLLRAATNGDLSLFLDQIP